MSVQVIITDPSKTSPVELQAVIRMLQGFAVATIDPALPITAEDLPSAGAPLLTPAAAFSPTGDVAAAAAFGGNASAATPIASSLTHAPLGAVAFTVPNAAPLAGTPADPAAAFAFNPANNFPVGGVLVGGFPQMPQLTSEQQGLAAGPGAGPATPGPLLDSNGDKWDERIHAGSKTTNKDGSFKLKPKVDKALVAQVLAANKGAGSYPFPSTAAQVAPPASAGTPQMNALGAPLVNPAQQAVALAQAAASVSAATNVSPSSAVSYIQLLTHVQQRMVAQQLTAEEMIAICNQHGAADLPALVSAPPNILESVAKHMMALLQAKGVA